MASAHASIAPSLADLAATAGRAQGQLYGGDISPHDAYRYMQTNAVTLVDVRTLQEWQGGIPDVSGTQADLLTLSWKTPPDYALNPDFAATLAASHSRKDVPLFFICHSGGRSLDAAIAMTAQGYRHCFNVSGGFEHWKQSQLPSTRG